MGINYHMPAPSVEYSSIFFQGATQVRADSFPGVTLKLRYTTDGTKPTLKSPVYTGPVTVNKGCTVSFAYVNSQGQAGDVEKVDCRPFEATNYGDLVPGLAGKRYLIPATTTKLPNFQAMKPDSTFVAQTIDESARPRPTSFGVSWTGYLVVPVQGVYSFALTSDDGSRLTLNDAVVVDNDGPHGAVAKTGAAWLQAGTYRFAVNWFDQGGANSLKVQMGGPNVPFGPIPASMLFRSNN